MQLTVRDLTFSYHHVKGQPIPILVDLNLIVPTGSSVALVGPSGTGKSTLLALLGGQLSPTAGAIDRSPEGGRIAWIFQTTNILTRRSSLDNVALPLLALGIEGTKARGAAAAALTEVGLSERVDALGHTLSGGERQRVCIARALVVNPDLVLADEPTGQLDVRTSEAVVASLVEAAQGRTLVVATHDHAVAAACDAIIELNELER